MKFSLDNCFRLLRAEYGDPISLKLLQWHYLKATLFPCLVICTQLIAQAWTSADTRSKRTPLRHKYRTNIAFVQHCFRSLAEIKGSSNIYILLNLDAAYCNFCHFLWQSTYCMPTERSFSLRLYALKSEGLILLEYSLSLFILMHLNLKTMQPSLRSEEQDRISDVTWIINLKSLWYKESS